MPSKRTFELSPEQLALQAARRTKKTGQPVPESAPPSSQQTRILQREWLNVQRLSETQADDRVSLMTWNMLAQSLVRRELFPSSDALKFSDRGPMLSAEILTYDADILCLQEVDKLDVLLPTIESRYSHVSAFGRKKEHGCMILFKKDLFELESSQKVYYDEEDVRQDDSQPDTWRRGSSRATKNIGLIAALKRKGDNGNGFVVATTHLFWHPAFLYERSRQVGILLRSVSIFRRENNLESWSCFIAGDFNLSPDDASYSLLVGETLTSAQIQAQQASRVVHVSIDPTLTKTYEPKPRVETKDEEEGESEEKDPDRVIANSRPCVPSDGLLELEELQELYRTSGMTPLRSLYDEFLRLQPEENVRSLKERLTILEGRLGENEPMFTNYTHFWKLTLDYIFLLLPNGRSASVEAILRPHKAEDMGEGLPKKGVCGSDHISLAAKIATETDTFKRVMQHFDQTGIELRGRKLLGPNPLMSSVGVKLGRLEMIEPSPDLDG